MSLRAVIKVTNLFLALTAFLVVGVVSLTGGEEPLWAAAKSVGCFVGVWIVLGYLASILTLGIEGPEAAGDSLGGNGKARRGKREG